MRAVWNNITVAEADKKDLIYIEGNWYFPPNSVKNEYLTKSQTPYTCPWKGECQYFTLVDGRAKSQDAAFTYPEPKKGALEIVKNDFSNYIAFWQDVQIFE